MTAQVLTTADRRVVRVAPLSREQARPPEMWAIEDKIRRDLGQRPIAPPLVRA